MYQQSRQSTFNHHSSVADDWENVHSQMLAVQKKSVSANSSASTDGLDIPAALEWYKNEGKGIKNKRKETARLYEIAGTEAKDCYVQALSESPQIGEGFVKLVGEAQEKLKIPIDGKLDANTRMRMDEWRTGGKHGMDYSKLLADKTLDIGVAIGYGFSTEFDKIVKLLVDEGFVQGAKTENQVTYSAKRTVNIPGDKTPEAVEITINVDVASPAGKETKEAFSSFLATKDIALYSGDARSGIGPDFDDSVRTEGNFVIGRNSSLHDGKSDKIKEGSNPYFNKVLKDNPNDLETMSKEGKFDRKKYQVWMFNACTSKDYEDEIRNGLVTDKEGKSKSAKDLRIFGTTQTITADCVPILQGLLNLDSMSTIISTMDEYEKKKVAEENSKKNENETPDPVHDSYYYSD